MNKNNKVSYDYNHNKGFSLIELSIVLIIMGLLVAGITGGAALIKSAQLRTVMTEFQNYRVAFNTYYGLYDKVPGVATSGGANTVDTSKGAWDDLKEEGIIEKSCDSAGFLSSKYKSSYWVIENVASTAGTGLTDFKGINALIFTGKGSSSNLTGTLGNREATSLLEKLDDGSPNTGLIRAAAPSESGSAVDLANQAAASSLDSETVLYILISKLDF
jgi:prepilin-type N-terminal cleavage/methylation domain-containing protein